MPLQKTALSSYVNGSPSLSLGGLGLGLGVGLRGGGGLLGILGASGILGALVSPGLSRLVVFRRSLGAIGAFDLWAHIRFP
jgi:hypothetical protein